MEQYQKSSQQQSPSSQTSRASSRLPEEAVREAERHRLGIPLRRYEDTGSPSLAGIIFCIDCIWIISVVLLIFTTPPDDILLWLCWAVIVLGTLIFAIGCTWALAQMAISAIAHTWKRHYLCTDGLLIIRGNNRVIVAIRWEDVTHIYPDRGMYQLITKEKMSVTIPQKGNVKELKKLGEPFSEAFKRLYA